MIKLKHLIVEGWNSDIWNSNIEQSDLWNSNIEPSNVWESAAVESSTNKKIKPVVKLFIYNVWKVMDKEDRFSPYQFSLWMDNTTYLERLKEKIVNQLYPNDDDGNYKFFNNDIIPSLEILEQQVYSRMMRKINTQDPLFILKHIVQRKSYEAAKKELFNSQISARDVDIRQISEEEIQQIFERLYRHAMGETFYNSGIDKLPKLSDIKLPSEDTSTTIFIQQFAGFKTEKFPDEVIVWRGTNSPANQIKPGDYVTFDRDYADSYSRGKFRAVVKSKLPSKDLRIYKMDVDTSELIYWPDGHSIKTYTGTIPTFKDFWEMYK